MSLQSKLTRAIYVLTASFVCGGVSWVRGDGLQNEYLVTQRWHDLMSSHSPLTNPAFLTEENYTTVRLAFAPTLQSAFTLWEGGMTIPFGLYQSVGLSWLGLNTGNLTPGLSSGIDSTTSERGSAHNYFMVSYAINPWNRLSVGANVNLAHEDLFGEQHISPGVDLAVSYRLLRHPIVGNHVVGLSLQNVLAPGFKGSDGMSDSHSRALRVSWQAALLEKRVDAGVDFDLKDLLSNKELFRQPDLTSAAAILEYEMYARLGVWLMRVFRLYGLFGIGENGSGYWGLAGGLNIPSVNNGRDLEVLYQYNLMTYGEAISTHAIYFRGELGKHREEIYARKMARFLDASPNDLYNRALSLYHSGKYWEAFFVFGQILSQFPDFFKNDWVSYYLRGCQEELDMRGSASQGYYAVKEAYPQSEMVPYADLGVMRIAYREGNHTSVYTQFSALNRPGVPDSLKYHACYIMAQTHVREGDAAKAVSLFSVVPETHPMYPFAQHSLAVSYALSGNVQSAVTALENAIQSEATSPVRQEIINRSYIFLGYIFYEEQSLSKAVASLRKVPVSSYYYEDALLGLGWAAIKAKQWADCASAGQSLMKISTKPTIQCEGALLAAYAAMLQKNTAAAVTLLRDASSKLDKLAAPSPDSLTMRERGYGTDRTAYEGIAASAYELATARQTSVVLKMIDSLHVNQKEKKANIDDFLRYYDEFGRGNFFARGIERIRADVEYALATAEKMGGGARLDKGVIQEQKELDQEIERVRKEMKKLEDTQGSE